MTAIAVTIAGSDSSGGAGIQADLKTFSALGVYGASVIAALTAQNTQGVSAIHDVPPDFITAQIDAVFSDLAVDAVKIGMLSTPAAIEAVAEGLDRYGQKKIVLDPVMVAATGARLLVPEAVETLKRRLFPRARLITPNLPEAAALLDIEVATNEAEMHAQADRLLALGAQAVLIKGGHGSGTESVDLLVERAGIARFVASRIATENSHGSGCTLSAAIAAGLAKGAALGDAVGAAKDFISRAIAAANRLAIGSGHGPVHHLHAWW
jgi:hydroxymethylpyrimidine/phosphomethylpyrimidine kinase